MEEKNFLDPKEQELFNIAKQAEEDAGSLVDGTDGAVKTPVSSVDGVRSRYQRDGIKLYSITATLAEDDDTEEEVDFLFKRPSTGSYDRYVKTMSTSMTKASKAFVLDNIIEEQRQGLRDMLADYPALAISISGKLLSMLGLADGVSVKKA